MSAEIVWKSFKKCCITTALNGSKADLLWENVENDPSNDDFSSLNDDDFDDPSSSDNCSDNE